MKKVTISIVITAFLTWLMYYLFLPALNLKSFGFWVFTSLILLILTFVSAIVDNVFDPYSDSSLFTKSVSRTWGIFLLIIAVLTLASGTLFHAIAYSNLLKVEDGDVSDIPSVEKVDSLALMDTDSAVQLGDREIGSLSEVISQYDVGDYFQINYNDTPMKVAPLEYSGLFKYEDNKYDGIPGYISVSPTTMDSEYHEFSKPIYYSKSAFFGQDITRLIRFKYPSLMFDNLHFEIDEDGNPYYIVTVYDHTIGLFGGSKVIGAIIVDPTDGSMEYYHVDDVPKWVDCVYNGDFICDQYNYYGKLSGGFWNSIFGQKGCKSVTTADSEDSLSYSDYGYIAYDGDIWIFTGVTSVNSDSSNIGFIISDERTEETKFVSCSGADEFSAMNAAEGEVQDKHYVASFPSLTLINNEPSYVMVLKDDNNLVKLYAIVNAEQYNKVTTATTLNECINNYTELVGGTVVNDDLETKTITVVKQQVADTKGTSWVYILDSEGNTYKAKYSDVPEIIKVSDGDKITIKTDGKTFELSE